MRVPLVLSVAWRFLGHEPRLGRGLRLAGVTLWVWLRSRLRGTGPPVWTRVTVAPGTEAHIPIRSYIDVLVLREIVLDGDYRVPAGRPVRTLLDLGSNTGISILIFKAWYPEAQVIGVEPDPASLPILRRNTVDCPGVTIVPAAATAHGAPSSFQSTPLSWASHLADHPAPGGKTVTVRTARIDELLAEGGLTKVDVVKLDIEGGEWPLLDSGVLQAVTDCIVGELHHYGDRTVDSAREAFTGWDFRVHRREGSASSFTAVRRGR